MATEKKAPGNMAIYEAARAVPKEAQKPITGGRLNNFTDISPMWRIKRLTEIFGPCGVGWWYEITDKQLVDGTEGQIAAFVDILLYHRTESGEPSHGIPGIGGNMFIAKEKRGLHTSDEAFKMALTDALGVAAKALGIGADIYFMKDATKYDSPPKETEQRTPAQITKQTTEALTQKPTGSQKQGQDGTNRGPDIQTQRETVINAFSALNIGKQTLENEVGVAYEKWQEKEIEDLRIYYKTKAAQGVTP